MAQVLMLFIFSGSFSTNLQSACEVFDILSTRRRSSRFLSQKEVRESTEKLRTCVSQADIPAVSLEVFTKIPTEYCYDGWPTGL